MPRNPDSTRKPRKKSAPLPPASTPHVRVGKAIKHNWEQIEKVYIYGEKGEDSAETAMPTFSSLAILAVRFGIPHGTVCVYAAAHNWTDLRAQARLGIIEQTHIAMCKQASENYIPIRVAAVAMVADAFTQAKAGLTAMDAAGKAQASTHVMQTVDLGLKNLDRAMGIQQPMTIAVQQNNLFMQQRKEGEEAPPPSHAPLIDPSLSGSLWDLILRSREAVGADGREDLSAYEKATTLPAHLSSVPHG